MRRDRERIRKENQYDKIKRLEKKEQHRAPQRKEKCHISEEDGKEIRKAEATINMQL